MTSPLSSLGKIRRMPFNMHSQGKRAVPFRDSGLNGDEEVLMDEILGPGAQIPVQVSGPSCSRGTPARPAIQEDAPSDMELMTSMMQKIAVLEQKVRSQAHAIHHKDKKIKELEEQMKILQKGSEESSGLSKMEELEVICLQLQHQVWEMERFLNDYGLIWVGEQNESSEEMESLDGERSHSSRGLWKPGDSVVSVSSINFDTIFENLKDLNVLAGEGVSQIEHVAGGARLRQPEPVSLTFYQNGIVMFNGPFRSYEEPSTQQCLRDLMDGYFPSELQRRYPDGVPFQVTDKREVVFRERQLAENFPGQGRVIGNPAPSGMAETTEIPGPKLTLQQFMNRLPKSLIRDEHVIDIRREIGETLQGSNKTQKHEVILVETPSLMAMKKRLEGDVQEKAPDPNISTLRIKSENGEKTYIIKMPFTETIGDLRQHLAQSRGGELESYEILSIFPQQVYNNNAMTLEECGLVPNGSLLLRRKASPSKSPGKQL
ncbi:UBX domain-containing protein 11 [Paroedura picta]|uniref:UBX domain-containing protein 11 n=1 Tax=Paroedura picta TaxID=143630 RepID=UPI0040573CC5